MNITYSIIKANEAEDYTPTDCAYAYEEGTTVRGVLQQYADEVCVESAEEKARAEFGEGATLRGEGTDIEGGVQWLVIGGRE